MDTTQTGLNHEQLDSLATLHTRTVDARAGFATMVEKAEPHFRAIARRFHDLHDQHATQLAALLETHGRAPDRDGSFMSTVNTMVVSARALFDEIDEDVMDQVRDGERHVLTAMDDAYSAIPSPTVSKAVERMERELTALLDETRHLD